MILFQFRSGDEAQFNKKYVIFSQRLRGSQTERVTGPLISLNAVAPSGPRQWIDVINPVLKFNPVTGRHARDTPNFSVVRSGLMTSVKILPYRSTKLG